VEGSKEGGREGGRKGGRKGGNGLPLTRVEGFGAGEGADPFVDVARAQRQDGLGLGAHQEARHVKVVHRHVLWRSRGVRWSFWKECRA
jgi:hypothetical protein